MFQKLSQYFRRLYERSKRLRMNELESESGEMNSLLQDGAEFCCPSKTELIQPSFGRNQSGTIHVNNPNYKKILFLLF